MIREYLGMFLGCVGDVLGELRQWLRDVFGFVDKRQSEGVGGLSGPNGLSHASCYMTVLSSSSKSVFVVLYSR